MLFGYFGFMGHTVASKATHQRYRFSPCRNLNIHRLFSGTPSRRFVLSAASVLMLFMAIGCQNQNNSSSPSIPKGPVFHNGWVSSGGKIFKTRGNPWFLHNTKEVSYCIRYSANQLSLSLLEVKEAIKKSISYWQRELAPHNEAIDKGYKYLSYRLATQKFVFQNQCSDATDLQFVLGENSLSQQERQFIKDPEQNLALTVRTSYNRKVMRGKGFIYVSGDIGSSHKHPMVASLSQQGVNISLWQLHNYFHYLLIHELGHVLGFPHTRTGLMRETFADDLSSGRTPELTLNAGSRQGEWPFLRHPSVYSSCLIDYDHLNWWGLETPHQPNRFLQIFKYCLDIEAEGEWLGFLRADTYGESKEPLRLNIRSRKIKEESESDYVGYILLNPIDYQLSYPVDTSIQVLSTLEIPPEQQVFPKEAVQVDFSTFGHKLPEQVRQEIREAFPFLGQVKTKLPYRFGPSFIETGISGQLYRDKLSEPVPVYVRVSPSGLSVLAYDGHKPNMVFNSFSTIY